MGQGVFGGKSIFGFKLRILWNLGANEMNWFEKFLEEILAVNAYLFWQKCLRQENRDKNSEEKSDS